MIYEPAEDSYLLQKQVKKFTKKEMKVLDLGTGSGIQAITAKKLGAEVLATDINQECIIKLKNRVKLRVNRYEYLWADGHSVKTPLKVCASEYIDYLMTWVENQLNNEHIFPYQQGIIL